MKLFLSFLIMLYSINGFSQQDSKPVASLSYFWGSLHNGLSGQLDINKSWSIQGTVGIGFNVWNRRNSQYPLTYTKANTREPVTDYHWLFGGLYLWHAAFADLQVRAYITTPNRKIPSPYAEGMYLGFRAKLNSNEFGDRYFYNPESRFMSTTQFHPNIGWKRYFSTNSRVFIDLSGGFGFIANQDFKTMSFNSSICFKFGIRIL